MYEIILINKNGDRFSEIFDSEYLYNKFLNKVKHSKDLLLVSYGRC